MLSSIDFSSVPRAVGRAWGSSRGAEGKRTPLQQGVSCLAWYGAFQAASALMPGMPPQRVILSRLARNAPTMQLQQPGYSRRDTALREGTQTGLTWRPCAIWHGIIVGCPAVPLCLGGGGHLLRQVWRQGAAALVCDVRGEFRAVPSGSEGP